MSARLSTPRVPLVVPVAIAVRGRARLHVRGLRGRPALANRLEDALGRHPAVHRISASPTTGNVLVLFDADRLGMAVLGRELAKHVTGRMAAPPPVAEAPAWHAITPTGVAARLGVDAERGLSTDEATRRLAAYGPNRVPVPAPTSRLDTLRGQLGSAPVLALVAGTGLAIVTGAIVEAGVILAAVAVNAAIGYVTERRVGAMLAALERRREAEVTVVRDGVEFRLPADALVPGDVIVLDGGDEVPADARLLTVHGLIVDEAALTGESAPVGKTADVVRALETAMAERDNMVFAGTSVAEGRALAVVVATGRDSEFGRVRRLVSETETRRTGLERQLDATGRTLVLASLVCCGGAFALGLARGIPAVQMLGVAVALAVAAVPEGLPAVATTTLAIGVRRMARRRVLVRRLSAVENLGATTVICADKTGTLTENRMTVRAWYLGEREYEVGGQSAKGHASLDDLHRRALTAAVLCNDADLNGADSRGSSTERALLAAALHAGLDFRDVRRRHPLLGGRPRGNGANWMGTVHGNGAGNLVVVKGAPETVLARASRWLHRGAVEPLTTEARAAILRANDGMAGRGMRVLGLALGHVPHGHDVSYDDLEWVGLVGMSDPVRPGVREAIAACRGAGIRAVILTGDQAPTAAAVCRELGLVPDGDIRVVDAAALARMDHDALVAAAREAHVFARVTPADKYRIVRALQAAGEVVAMTGDGINDAAALKAADVGVAMGAGGTDVAREVADVVLLDDNFHSLVDAIEQGRAIRDNVDRVVKFLVATNASEIAVTLGTIARGAGTGLSAIQLLWLNLLSDLAPALALAVEPPAVDVMRRPPRDPAVPVLSASTMRGLAVDASVMGVATLAAGAVAERWYGVGARASSVTFSALAATQFAHALAVRAGRATAMSGHASLLSAVVAGSVAVQAAAVTAPPLMRLLGTAPLGLAGWWLTGAAAVAGLVRGVRALATHGAAADSRGARSKGET